MMVLSFVDSTLEHKPQIVGMSALLTTTMMAMQDTIQAFSEHNLREQTKIIVGGAPVTQEFADKIEADGFAPDAAAAARLASQLVGIASDKKPQGLSDEQSGTGTKSNQSRITRQAAG